MKKTIRFEKSLSKEILEIFDKEVNEEGLIVEKSDPSQKVLSPEGDEISSEEFAGITKGSEVFIKSDLASLMNFSKKSK